MEDLFKKFVNAGVGLISQGNKRVQSTIDKLVQESKLSEQEGKKIVDDLMKSSETKVKELETQFKGLTDTMKKTVGMGGSQDAKASKSGASKPANSKADGSKSKSSSGASGAAKTANSAASKAAGTVKKAADSVGKAASTTQHSAAAKAGATKKPAAKKAAPANQDGGQPADDKSN